jgi:phenylacetate-coenzyme A ligase PaaK-like adenylate-forming protein
MTGQDFSILDLPRTAPVDDPDAYLRTAVQWHFGEETGSRFWLERAETLDFDPRTDIRTFDDLAKFPNVVDEWRDVPVRDLIPAGYGPDAATPRIFESGGTTGAPKRVIIMPDWEAQSVEWELAEITDLEPLRGRGMLLVSANGPHAVGYTQTQLAAALDCTLFTVDMDPRWVKRLATAGDAAGVDAYVEHLIDQARYVLTTQDISVMMTTPPLLTAMARHDDLIDAIGAKVALLKLGGAHLDEDTRLLFADMFPSTRLLDVYGSTMVLGQAHTRVTENAEDPVVHDGRPPYITFMVVDPGTGSRVAVGERGQIVMHHVSKSMFIPNNLERDTAIRVAAPDGHIGDSVSDIAPVASFKGETVVEGVY